MGNDSTERVNKLKKAFAASIQTFGEGLKISPRFIVITTDEFRILSYDLDYDDCLLKLLITEK